MGIVKRGSVVAVFAVAALAGCDRSQSSESSADKTRPASGEPKTSVAAPIAPRTAPVGNDNKSDVAVARNPSAFPAKELREAIEAEARKWKFCKLVTARVAKSDDLEFPYALQLTVTSDFRTNPDPIMNQGRAKQATYTYQIDSDLRKSESYAVTGGEDPAESVDVSRAVREALKVAKQR